MRLCRNDSESYHEQVNSDISPFLRRQRRRCHLSRPLDCTIGINGLDANLFIFSAWWIGIGAVARGVSASPTPAISITASAPNAAGLRRQARCIAAGNARHRHRDDDDLGRGPHRLRCIVLSAEAKAGENELRSGSYVFEEVSLRCFLAGQSGSYFLLYYVEAC